MNKRHIPIAIARQGATLSEVLISILIMSIGLVSVASLFPLAMVRSIHGHALTTATNLRYTAEGQLDLHPEFIRDPNRNNTPFESGEIGNAFIVDPLGAWGHEDYSNDLLGAGYLATGRLVAGTNTIARYDAGLLNKTSPRRDHAERIFGSMDQWTNLIEERSGSATATQVTVPGLTQQGVYLGTTTIPIPTRLVIFNQQSDAAIVREISVATATVDAEGRITSNTVNVSPDIPSAFQTPGLVRVEQNDLRFTWLVTVRPTSAVSGEIVYEQDIVVFFNRGYSPEDMQPYSNGADMVFTEKSTTVNVMWTGDAPFLKKGSFVLDAQNGHWYRIQDYAENSGSATLTLDSPARKNGSVAVFMKAIVDVYPIRRIQVD